MPDEENAGRAPLALGAAAALKSPRLDFSFESRVRLGELTEMGKYRDGHKRGTLQLLGGEFEGPAIRGTILPSTKDWPVYYGNGVRLTDVDYVYRAEDGSHLFVTVRGYRYDPEAMTGALGEAESVDPPGNLLRAFVRIEAPLSSPHAWLSHNLFVGVGGSGGTLQPDRTAVLRVYRLL